MEAAANLLLVIVSFAVFAIWIVSLAKWDGRRPCEPEDCDRCPYNGTGCKPEKQSTNTNETVENKKGKQS